MYTNLSDLLLALEQIKDIQGDRKVIDIQYYPFNLDKSNYGAKLLEVTFTNNHKESIELP